jgi:hypothetical protein
MLANGKEAKDQALENYIGQTVLIMKDNVNFLLITIRVK